MARRRATEKKKSDWKAPEEIQKALLVHLTDEFNVAKKNNEQINKDFVSYYNMIHAVRDKKPNDWESDIFLPEFVSRLLTQVGNFVAQYFTSTDYVESDLDSEDPKDIAEAKASKKLLNALLNDKEAYYYAKIVRNIMFVFAQGYGIVKGGYEQEVEKALSHYEVESELVMDAEGNYIAQDGLPYLDPTLKKPMYQQKETPKFKNNVIKDRPCFDVYPPQNVYMSPEYCYTLNDKEYIIFESEATLSKLRKQAKQYGYFNLDLLEEENPEGRRGEKTYDKDNKLVQQPNPPEKTFVILEYWQKYPVVVQDDGTYLPGVDDKGEFKEGATLEECIITFAKGRENDDARHVIRFQKSPHSKRPMVRFLCYVDMINDNGFGDGEVNKELSRAINDNYNLMNYRTKLAITPAFKGKRFSGIDENVRISPEKVTMLENLDDLQEFKIEDNIQGGIVHHNLLTSRMDYAMATSPQSMGMSPERAETATIGAIINQRANIRIGMKSMNLEFIGFTEFYDMLLTLCNDFMLPETLEQIIGKEFASAYNPKRKDKFKPVSQALETDDSKQYKLKTWQGILGMVAPIQNPKTPMVVNYIIGQMLEILGGNFSHFKKFMFDEDPKNVILYQLATGAKGGAGSPPGAPLTPTQNQSGLPQPVVEQTTRMMAPRQEMMNA